MPRYVALLRAINVGGTGKLPMAVLKRLCSDAAFEQVETYVASGNAVFTSPASPSKVKSMLEQRLQRYAGKPVGVVIRTAEEMAVVLKTNPFHRSSPQYTVVIFLDQSPPSDALQDAKGRTDEKIQFGEREIFVHYPSGIGRSKLRIPAAKSGTARNMNTVARLAQKASDLR
jgi:uncharacterized protein (DUF1697 family)